MATKITISPEQQIQNVSSALQETEYRLGQKGIDMYLMRTWLNQSLLLRAMLEKDGRGELQVIEFDQEDGDY